MATICPNLSDPHTADQFEWLVEILQSEEAAYTIWHNNAGDIEAIHNEMMRRKENEGKPIHPNPTIQSDFEKYGRKNVTNINNSIVRRIEKKLGTAKYEGDKRGKYTVYTGKEADAVIAEVKKLGANAIKKEVYIKDRYIPNPFIVISYYNIGEEYQDSNLIPVSDTHMSMPYDLPSLENYVDIADEGTSLLNLLDMIRNNESDIFENRKDLRDLYTFVMKQRRKFSKAKVYSSAFNGDGYMRHKQGNIAMHPINIKARPNLEYFIESLLHETVHTATVEALRNPLTQIDRSFNEAVTSAFNAAIDSKAVDTLEYGLKDKYEFVAEALTNQDFAEKLKKVNVPNENKSILRSFIDAILRFLGIRTDNTESAYSTIVNNFETFIASEQNTRGFEELTHTGRRLDRYFADGQDRKVKTPRPESRRETIKILTDMNNMVDKDLLNSEKHEYYVKDLNRTFTSTSKYLEQFGYGISEEVKTSSSRFFLDPASNLGTAIHANLEGTVNDIVEDIGLMTGYEVNEESKVQLTRVIEDIKKNTNAKSLKILSELSIFDVEKGLAGTIDLVTIDEKNRIRIYDFKTSESGFEDYEKNYRNRGKISPSSKEKYRMQLYTYKTMLERILNIPIVSQTVVMLKPVVDYEALAIDKQTTIGDLKANSLDPSEDLVIKRTGKLFISTKLFKFIQQGAGLEVHMGENLQEGTKLPLRINKAELSKEHKGFLEVDYTLVPNEVVNIALDRSASDTGMDTFKKMSPKQMREFRSNIYKESKNLKFNDNVAGNKEDSERYDREMRDWQVSKSQLTDLERIADQAEQAMLRRLAIVQARYSLTEREKFQEFIDDLMKEETTTGSLVNIIRYASQLTSELNQEYEEARSNNSLNSYKTGIPLLRKWSDYLIAFDTLNELQHLVEEDNTVFKDPEVVKILEETVKVKDKLKEQYFSRGEKLIAQWLTPYYDGLRRERKDEYAKKYKSLVKAKKKKGATIEEIEAEIGTEEQYVEEKIIDNEEELSINTQNLISSELKTAARDISVAARWMDNVLDSSDVVVSAMVNAFQKETDAARLEAVEKRGEVLDKLIAMEKYKSKGGFTAESEFYKNLLELNEKGKPNQYLTMPWKSTLIEDAEAVRKRAYKENSDRLVASQKYNAWLDRQISRNDDEYFDAMGAFLDEAVEKEILEYQEARNVWSVVFDSRKNVTQGVKDGSFKEETGDLLMSWIRNNRWKYAKDIAPEYKSEHWDSWMKEIGIDTTQSIAKQLDAVEASDNPEAQMYTLLKGLGEQADNALPYSYNIGTRLPGVAISNFERIKKGQSFATYTKENIKKNIFVRPEDTEHGDVELTDEHGRAKYFLPIHYTTQIEPKNQSYDLAGIYFKYWSDANEYAKKRQILPQMEMAKELVKKRSAFRRNSLGEVIKRAGRSIGVGGENASIIDNTNLAKQLEDWFMMAVYGKKHSDDMIIQMFGKEIDASKFFNALTKFTSINLLAGNTVQAVANVTLGEAMEAIEAIAGEHVSPKTMTQATAYYSRNLPKMLVTHDLGSREMKTTPNLLIEFFDIMHEDISRDTVFHKKSKVGNLMNQSSLYAFQSMGEHWMQGRFLFAMLLEKDAFDENGKKIGNMLSQYYTDENGKLRINKDVSLEKSYWTEEHQQAFKVKVKRLLSRMHGEYSELGRVAAQRTALGNLAYQFRKFIVPGIRRRYGRKTYIQGLDQVVEGNYRTTVKFAYGLMKDIFGLSDSLKTEWSGLNDHEKANIHRTISELVLFITLYILMSAFFKDDDDDYAKGDEPWLWEFSEYQIARLSTELGFFTMPGQTLQIMRSPAASMAVLENIGRFINDAFNFNEVYERGPWKGQRKIKKSTMQLIPLYKQYYRVRDVGQATPWLKR